MLKWVFLFAIGYIAYRYWLRVSANRASTKSERGIEQMLECAHCGIRFPESEAVRSEDKVFCSGQHRALWKQSR